MRQPIHTDRFDVAVEHILQRLGPQLRLGAPLGIGKPHRLLNAIHARAVADPTLTLRIYSALSLNPPTAATGLEGRFLAPFVARHFGTDFVRLAYADAQRRGALPANIGVEEFYLQSGAMLGAAQVQQQYVSLNYTHVAPALARRAVNIIVQKVAREPAPIAGTTPRLSLSCNTDLTFDAVDAIVARGLPRPLLVAEIDPQLPWLGGGAAVDADWFDIVIDPPGPYPQLFGLPRQPVSDADYAIGFFASALVRDGGTLQIGIGALSDALCHALVLRQRDNVAYRRILHALDPHIEQHSAVRESGGLGVFETGLYGASEMINEGFMHLLRAGVLKRAVVEDRAVMQRLNAGTASADDLALCERDGVLLHGAFYLGSPDFYAWLRALPPEQEKRIGMQRVSEVNQLYDGDEALERVQRRDARFFNSCMMMTALGAAVSDGLESGQVVSGVGGQYNFVAMAHALHDARSVLLLRATRDAGGDATSNVLWSYGHCTIPRHLRDIAITEYGIADLRDAADAQCVAAMLGLCDARFQAALRDTARRNGKLPADSTPSVATTNTPQRLRDTLAPFRRDGTLPDYPLGSDFTAVEQRLVKALGWLKSNTATTPRKLATVVRAVFGGAGTDADALQRMALASPRGLVERFEAKLLAFALQQTNTPD